MDPSYDWKTIETAHFSIHYPKYLGKIAEDFAPETEGIHRRLSPLFRHSPGIKTNIVLVDNFDYGNGMASVLPQPTVILYVTDTGSNLSPYSYREWLKYVFTHEYSHILHLDTVEGGAIMTNLLFGRVLFPNSLNPGFIVEGMAVYMESHYGRGGRIFNPRFEAQMRMDILEDNMKTIGQSAVDTTKWPGRNLWYVYGAYFIEYLADKYGQDKLFRMSKIYSDFVLYDGIDNCYRLLFGKSLAELWDEWIEHEKGKYFEESGRLSAQGLTEPEKTTQSGFYNLQPSWSDDSQHIYYAHRDFGSYPAIRKVSRDLSDSAVIETNAFDDNMDVAGGKLVYSKAQIYNNYYYYKDLYLMDLSSKKLVRLTRGERAGDPSFSRDGGKIIFTKLNEGSRSLWIMDAASQKASPVTEEKKGVSYFSPVFSPDGEKIAAAKWADGKQSIYLVNLGTGNEYRIPAEGLCGNPCFSDDGKFVFFDSDLSGISNIYAYNIQNKKLLQVTNVLGMALMPAPSPDMTRIAYVNYSSQGYDLSVIPYAPEKWREVSSLAVKDTKEAEDIPPRMVSVRKTGYNPVPALLPKFWMPFSVLDENGRHTSIFTLGMDSLSQHMYQGEISYDWTARRPIYQLMYSNNQFLPQISIMGVDYPMAYSWDSGTATYWERYRNQSLYLSFPQYVIFKEYDAQSFVFGFENINLTNITSLSALATRPDLGNIRGVGAGYRYISSRSYQSSISPEDGFDLSLNAKLYSKQLGSQYEFTNYSTSFNQYLPLPPEHHVLALSETGFLSAGDQLKQGDFTWRYLSVRGYPSTFLSGTKGTFLSAQYRFPISYLEKGLSYGYTFFDRIYGNLFFEAGGATFGSARSIFLNKAVGGEITLKTINGFGYVPIYVSLSYAKGLDPGGENKLYLSIAGGGFNTTIGNERSAILR